MIGVTHKECGELAFRLNPDALQIGKPIRSKDLFNLDGTNPKPGEQAVCGSCGKKVNFTAEELKL